jgi:[protein-PII] uridylyltransferase
LLDQLPQEQLLIDFQDNDSGQLTEMTLVTYDDETPGLLSKICGVMLASSVEILTAQVHTLRAEGEEGDQLLLPTSSLQPASPDILKDVVLDRLQLAAHGRALGEAKKARLAAVLRAVLSEGKSVEELLCETGKEVKQAIVPQRISARNDLSDEHTVLTVMSDNLPGLLFALTRALADIGLDIHTAKITTWGGRAEDAFYVTNRAGGERSEGLGKKINDDAVGEVLAALKARLQKQR